MTSICLYFEIHQPFRIKPFHFFDIGNIDGPYDYFDQDRNRSILNKVSAKSYRPATDLLLDLVHRHSGDFRFTLSVSGLALEQFQMWDPYIVDNLKRLADTGHVEFLAETYYHSLSSLYSEREFREQVYMHIRAMQKVIGYTPHSFRNTELIYSNHIAWLAASMGFQSILMEGADRVLGWRSPNFPYQAKYNPEIKCMLKNYSLSDDIAFRFGEKNWREWPLTADKFSRWAHEIAGNGTVLNLFMDFETLGEHQWADTGIFDFLESLPGSLLRHPDFSFSTVSEAVKRWPVVGEIDTNDPISWADTERDVTAWLGNNMQRQAAEALYELTEQVYATGDAALLDVFRKLQTSDHFYYMCTKWFSDGDVHKYFSPYNSPHDAYVYYMNVLHDLRQRAEHIQLVRDENEAQSIQKKLA
ncbi:MAG: glycoside hydrolase family 57 protein [Leptospiraceae bacterium]|nr:glycoside hydrolase family 57 protein [Leptospiraceae bacterium]